jgi:hypothetical protein
MRLNVGISCSTKNLKVQNECLLLCARRADTPVSGSGWVRQKQITNPDIA